MVLTAELAAELGEITSVGGEGVVSYQRGEVVFARVSADALEVRLPPDIADAAVRTPDTVALPGGSGARPGEPGSPPPGGPGWVRFSPNGQERHVTDRAAAWFHTAWRHAVGR
jgi:hypothetical protein